MMPDNKEESESPGEEAVNEDSASNIDSEQSDESVPENQADSSAQDNDANPEIDNDSEADNLAESDSDDPLQFGDKRMGDENEEPEDELAVLNRKLAEAEGKTAEHWDRLLRLQAEMENQRKRAQNDVNKARKFALESIVNDLLPVKDSLEMGIAAASAEDVDPKSIVEGAELTLKMLAQVFEKNNILEVNPVDEKFDPEFHQAMSMQEIEGKEPNTVTSVMQKGYTLNERLVRPALVMVSK
jgi:molecular chaperone GrpE